MYPSLSKSYKDAYPFKIATTSFIYPDVYLPNVRMLGPFVDEIELLIFESAPVKSLFSDAVIDELVMLSRQFEISYNVHLPTDISINDPDPGRQQLAVDCLSGIIARLSPLSPSSYTLHVPLDTAHSDNQNEDLWQACVRRNLKAILAAGVSSNLLTIETLDYPFRKIDSIISELDLSICMDIGHLILSGEDIEAFMKKYSDRISLIHLHGVKGHRDHISLAQMSGPMIEPVRSVLSGFTKTVSLEVFAFDDLTSSLDFLEHRLLLTSAHF
jgi:sugar phosphate isomerase/epimerase